MTRDNTDWLTHNAAPPHNETAATEDPGPEPDPSPAERRCLDCDTHLDPDQYYCLECGWTSEIAPALTKPRSLGPLVAAGLIGLGLVGGGVAFAALQGDDNSGDSAGLSTTEATTALDPAVTQPATTDGVLPPDPSATTTGEELPTTTDTGTATVGGDETAPDFGGGDEATTDTQTVPDATTDAATTPDPVDPAPEPASDWVDGQTAWTAIVSSVRSGTEAVGTKERVRAAGEPAGLAFSTDHPELRPGFWIVFSGVFTTRDEALRHAQDISGQFAGAYVRRISKP